MGNAKKILLFGTIALFSVLASGCAKKETVQNKASEALQQEEGGIISSIKDAMNLGKTMECTYSIKVGDETMKSKSYVKGKKYKSEYEADGKTYYTIFDGEKTMHSWVKGETKGTIMKTDCFDDLEKEPESASQKTEEPSSLKVGEEAFEDTYEVDCKPIAAVDFSLPENVVFEDQCETLKKQLEEIKSMTDKFQVPEGTKIPDVQLPQ